MPSLKNQHFVPRCLLKPFSKAGEGKSVNLYNIRGDRLIPNAPVKGQCASDYLYGKDGKLEKILSKLESSFSATRARVNDGEASDHDLNDINFFTYLQLRRTEMAVQRLRESYEKINLGVYENKDAMPIPEKHALVMQSLKFCMDTRAYVEDLKIRLIENRSDVDFILSDDPSIFTNRFAAQKLNGDSFGVSSSGLILTMPLSPKLAVICYDGLVYTASELEAGRFVIRKGSEADARNELQFLKAAENVYFQDWNSGDRIRQKFVAIKDKRPKEWSVIKHLVPVEGQENITKKAP